MVIVGSSKLDLDATNRPIHSLTSSLILSHALPHFKFHKAIPRVHGLVHNVRLLIDETFYIVPYLRMAQIQHGVRASPKGGLRSGTLLGKDNYTAWSGKVKAALLIHAYAPWHPLSPPSGP